MTRRYHRKVSLLISQQGFSPLSLSLFGDGRASVQLECYEILTNKNDVERGRERKRKWCDLQSPRIDARRALIGCSLSRSESERGKGEGEDLSSPDHFRVSYLSAIVFVLRLLLQFRR